ncbi:hypothetical protein EsH8_III_001376 [Colletotrichum jinshuiense]
MSTNVSCVTGADGRLYYYDEHHGQWYLYPTTSYSNPGQTTTQQTFQEQSSANASNYQSSYVDDRVEAGSFPGDFDETYNEDNRPVASSTTQNREKETADYLRTQDRDRKHRESLRDDTSRRSRHKHKKTTKRKMEETLKPLYK